MSAWIVDPGHIDVLIAAARQFGTLRQVSDVQLDGQMLWREPHRSFNRRYRRS